MGPNVGAYRVVSASRIAVPCLPPRPSVSSPAIDGTGSVGPVALQFWQQVNRWGDKSIDVELTTWYPNAMRSHIGGTMSFDFSLLRCVAPLVLVVAVSGCLPDENYEACRFPPEQKSVCIGEDKSTNCVVIHPHCPDDYCISWQGHDSFCTQKCKKNSDCPGDACCVSFILECEDQTDLDTCAKLCVTKDQMEDGVCPADGYVAPVTGNPDPAEDTSSAVEPDTNQTQPDLSFEGQDGLSE